MRRRLFPRRVPHVRGAPGAKSFVDDLILGRGFVRSRAAPSLRSIESQPSTQAFVRRSLARRLRRRPGAGRGRQGRRGGEGWSGPASPRRAAREGFAPASLSFLPSFPLRPLPPLSLSGVVRVDLAAPPSVGGAAQPPPTPPQRRPGAAGRPDAVREGGGTAPPSEGGERRRRGRAGARPAAR